MFCLSLMGSNIVDFIREAHRILRPGGLLKIVEVRSRFHDKELGDGLDAFQLVISNVGFTVVQEQSNQSNRMFFFLECTKRTDRDRDSDAAGAGAGADGASASKGGNKVRGSNGKKVKVDLNNYSAKPCLYKRR